jgi:hypothetical protein
MSEDENTLHLELVAPAEGEWVDIRHPRLIKVKTFKRIEQLKALAEKAAADGDTEQSTAYGAEMESIIQGMVKAWSFLDTESGEPLDPKAPAVFDELGMGQFAAFYNALQTAREDEGGLPKVPETSSSST